MKNNGRALLSILNFCTMYSNTSVQLTVNDAGI
uniref:Uncharacterized protein n=1 Tax=Anguilla anguilla TaxID=7936 RepID=A0A0E9SYT2_ANGAN